MPNEAYQKLENAGRAARLRALIDAELDGMDMYELYCVYFATQRLMGIGRDKYGPIHPEKTGRNWLREALEEELDKWNYLAMDSEKRGEALDN